MEKELSVKSFEPIKDRFIKLMNEESFLKEASFAMQHLNRNSYLAGSDVNSIIQSVLNIAQVGLTLNPVAKLAYLVPRMIGGKLTCCLEPSYMGLVKLLTDTCSITSIYCHVVYKDDSFEYSLGTKTEIIHKPKLGNKSEAIAVYAVAVLKDGSKQIELMTCEEINLIRDSSESYKAFKSGKVKKCIWDEFWSEMARKTVIKRITKYLPKTEQWDKVNEAIHLDNRDFQITDQQTSIIEGLLPFASFSEEKKEYIERELHLYTKDEASSLIEDLKANQLNPLHSGQPYSQSDILKHSK